MKTVRLKPGKERALLRRHPWVFEGSIARGGADAGEPCAWKPHDGRFLAWGAYSPASADPRARLELRRSRAHRRAFFERLQRAAVACAHGWRSPATACAWCTARPTACRAWSSTATATRCRRSSAPPASSAGAT
jgi:23S rRNA G2069 N7-methylase RlmK/C1962 C5-methylase RlmI